jgi:hypothetical protein
MNLGQLAQSIEDQLSKLAVDTGQREYIFDIMETIRDYEDMVYQEGYNEGYANALRMVNQGV